MPIERLRNDRLWRTVDKVVYPLILLSVFLISLESVPELQQHRSRMEMVEGAIAIIFSVEYIGRVLAADRWWRYVLSFYGLIDLFSILPFYISLGLFDAQSIRVLRIVRILRLAKLARYSAALDRLGQAARSIHRELLVFFSLSVITVYICAVGIYHLEREAQPEAFHSIFHAMWWSVSTLTTVGYGDVYPVTAGGKVFTGLVVMVGLGIVSVPSALLAASLQNIRETGEAEPPATDEEEQADGGP